MSTIIVLSTGGIKSAVAAARIADQHELVLVHVDYGQASARNQARAVQALMPTYPNARCVELTMPHIIELQRAMERSPRAGRSTARTAAPRGSMGTGANPMGTGANSMTTGANGSSEPEPLAPASLRGLWPVLCTVGAQCALRFGATEVAVGLTASESAIHLGLPVSGLKADARRAFAHALNIALDILSPKGYAVRLETPLIDLTYSETIKLAERFKVPLEKTWTCQADRQKPCEQCGPCRARATGFQQASMVDPAMLATAERVGR